MKLTRAIFYLSAFATASCSIAFALTLVGAPTGAVTTRSGQFLHHLLTYSWPAGLVVTALLGGFIHLMQKRRSRE